MHDMYKLHDFLDISNKGFKVTIPDDTVSQLNELVKQVGSPNYIRTPVFQKINNSGQQHYNSKRRRDRNENSTNHAEWEKIKFKTTKIEKKTGIEAQLSEIRTQLNKITSKTINTIVDNIYNITQDILAGEENEKSIVFRIGNMICEIASTNRIFSTMYAEAYGMLIEKYPVLYDYIEEYYNEYVSSFDIVETALPDEDYNAFCRITKYNDHRRASSAFFLNLYCSGVIPIEKIEAVIVKLLNTINKFVDIPDKEAEIDEYTENIAILYSNDIGYSDMKSLDNNLSIKECIEKYAETKSKTHCSLTTKCIFKYMDMCGK